MPRACVSREIERRIPTAAKLTTSDDPPSLTNGSVMPVRGISATTTAMLMNAWNVSQAVMPSASRAPNVSGASQRDADATPREKQEQADDQRRAEEAQLLADHREHEVVLARWGG